MILTWEEGKNELQKGLEFIPLSNEFCASRPSPLALRALGESAKTWLDPESGGERPRLTEYEGSSEVLFRRGFVG